MREMILVLLGLPWTFQKKRAVLNADSFEFGARCRVIDPRTTGVGVADDLFGEPHRRRVGRADIGRRIGDLAHLRGGGIGEHAAAVPDIDVPQPRQAVDHLAPVGEVEDRPPALLDNQRRLVVLGVMQRVDQKAPVALEQFRRAVHRILRQKTPS